MDKLTFSTPNQPDITLSVEEAQAILRKRFPDDTVDLAILSILAGKELNFTVNNVEITVKKA